MIENDIIISWDIIINKPHIIILECKFSPNLVSIIIDRNIVFQKKSASRVDFC
jgi:hypothetical protein